MYEQTQSTAVEAIGGSIVLLILFVLLAFITISWILVPFFILGTNRRLDAAVHELRLMHNTMVTFAQRAEAHRARTNDVTQQPVQTPGAARNQGGAPGWPQITE